MRVVHIQNTDITPSKKAVKRTSSDLMLKEAIYTAEREMHTRRVDLEKLFAKEINELSGLRNELSELKKLNNGKL